MTVALGRRYRGHIARHRRGTRRHNNRSVGITTHHAAIDTVQIIGAIASERSQRPVDLVEQRLHLRRVIDVLRRERGGDDLARVGVDADVQLAPRSADLRAVLFAQSLARTAQL